MNGVIFYLNLMKDLHGLNKSVQETRNYEVINEVLNKYEIIAIDR